MALGASFFLSAVAKADEWSYEIELYMIATSIEGNAGVPLASGAEIDVDFDKIMSVLYRGGMVHFEAIHESGWGTILDYAFMDLRDDLSGPRGGVAEMELYQGVFQADLLYRVPLGKGTLDYLAGIRWWENDIELTLDPALLPVSPKAEVKEDWVDVFVGARWITPLNENWELMLRGDVGGFGLEADFTSSVSAGLKYSMTETWVLDMQYKATWVDYETGKKGQANYFAYDTVTHGPLLGIIYKF